MPPRTRAGAGAGGDGDDEPTLLSIVELNKLFKDVVMFTPRSGVHDTNKALFRAWTRSIMLHAPVLEIVGRHAKADFGDIYDSEWAKIDQSERPQAAHMLAYFLKTKTAATAASLVRSLSGKGADAKGMFVKLAKMYGTYNDQGVSIRKQLAALNMRTLGGPTELQLELDDLSQLYEDTCGHALPEGAGPPVLSRRHGPARRPESPRT
ncbi:hypothetical protein JL720_10847 [Aureococcus anophagefferens]|nr:hypothetical protein JL720_10847 [Aureococcus anophagefferens]